MNGHQGGTSLIVVAVIGCALAAVGASSMPLENESPQTPAEMWLSWSPEAKAAFVDGYLHGFDRGKHDACYLHGEKMEALVHGSMPVEQRPEVVCMKSLPHFFESGHYQVYVDAVTKYYTKYPHDREGGLSNILSDLASPPGLSVDQIHAKVGNVP